MCVGGSHERGCARDGGSARPREGCGEFGCWGPGVGAGQAGAPAASSCNVQMRAEMSAAPFLHISHVPDGRAACDVRFFDSVQLHSHSALHRAPWRAAERCPLPRPGAGGGSRRASSTGPVSRNPQPTTAARRLCPSSFRQLKMQLFLLQNFSGERCRARRRRKRPFCRAHPLPAPFNQ